MAKERQQRETHFDGGISTAVKDLTSLNGLDCCHRSVTLSQFWIFQASLWFSKKVTIQSECKSAIGSFIKEVGTWLRWKDVEYRPLILGKRRVTCRAEMVLVGHHETLASMRVGPQRGEYAKCFSSLPRCRGSRKRWINQKQNYLWKFLTLLFNNILTWFIKKY